MIGKLLDFIFLGERPSSSLTRVVFIALPAIGLAYVTGHPV